MRRIPLLQKIDQHGNEPVDGVRVLTVTGDEAVEGKRVESTEGQGMAVNDHQGRLWRV